MKGGSRQERIVKVDKKWTGSRKGDENKVEQVQDEIKTCGRVVTDYVEWKRVMGFWWIRRRARTEWMSWNK